MCDVYLEVILIVRLEDDLDLESFKLSVLIDVIIKNVIF